MNTEPLIVFREIYKCGNCGAIVDPLSDSCTNCPAKFLSIDGVKRGIVVENIDQDIPHRGKYVSSGIYDPVQYQSPEPSAIREFNDGLLRARKTPDEVPTLSSGNIKQVVGLAEELGLMYDEKIEHEEIDRFNRSLRSIFREESVGVLYETILNNIGNLTLAFIVARKQTNTIFDGRMPLAGRMGIMPIVPSFFGKESWLLSEHELERMSDKRYWIHAGSGGFDGTVGNDVRMGESTVSIIFGVGDMLSLSGEERSPITGFTLKIDNREKPHINVSSSFPHMAFPFIAFDDAILLHNRTQIRAEVILRPKYEDRPIAPFLYGFSFALEYVMRTSDLWKHPRINSVSEPT